VTYIKQIPKISHIFLFAYFFLKIRYLLGLACGPPARCPLVVRGPQVENRCYTEYPKSCVNKCLISQITFLPNLLPCLNYGVDWNTWVRGTWRLGTWGWGTLGEGTCRQNASVTM